MNCRPLDVLLCTLVYHYSSLKNKQVFERERKSKFRRFDGERGGDAGLTVGLDLKGLFQP